MKRTKLEILVLAGSLVVLLAGFTAAPAAAQRPEHDHQGRPAGHSPSPHDGDGETAEADRSQRHEGPINHSFEDAELWAARFESAERDEWQMPDRVVEALALEPGMAIADIGSGTGYFARRFAAAVGAGGTVYASDVEPSMAVYVRERADEENQPNLVPVLASYDDPRLPAGSIDLVFICDTWHHIGGRIDYARRLAADLAPGGRLVIVDFVEGELPVGPGAVGKLSAREVIAELAAAGFTLAASHDFLPYQYFLVFAPPGGPDDGGGSG